MKTEIVHLLLKDPNELGCDNTVKHDTNGWVNLSVINVSVERFLQYPDESTYNPMGRIIKQILMH